MPALPPGEALCQNARRVAVLENVMNPTNLGALIRSAAALGVDAALLTPGCCDPLGRRAVRLSVAPGNPARAFYEKAGFVRVDTQPGALEPLWILELGL